MPKYRSRYDIIADVLSKTVGTGARLSGLYYSSAVSYGKLKGLLADLVSAGLLMRLDDTYTCTTKGARFLALYAEMDSLFGIKQPTKSQLDMALLNRAREYSLRLKEMDKESGRFLLQGRGRAVIDATSYYLIAKSEGRKITLSDASGVFKVSVNAISRMKRLIEASLSESGPQQRLAKGT